MTDMETTTSHESERQARAWLVHLTSGTATTEDGEAFRRWCLASPQHAEAFAHARRLWEDLGPAIEHRNRTSGRGDRPAPRHGVRMGRRMFISTAVTASVAAIAFVRYGLGAGVMGSEPGLRTAVGEQKEVQVSHGVDVELNTDTAIGLNKSAGHVTGMRLREGEAMVRIDAARAAPFVVELDDARVLSSPGASFAVRCVDGLSSVTCLDGETVLERGVARTLVKPSQQVALDASGMTQPVAVNPDTAFAWRQRVLIYDNQPLADVVADINRYRHGRIVITDRALGERRVHARFTLDQMADVASLIHDAYGAHVTHLPGDWVLLS